MVLQMKKHKTRGTNWLAGVEWYTPYNTLLPKLGPWRHCTCSTTPLPRTGGPDVELSAIPVMSRFEPDVVIIIRRPTCGLYMWFLASEWELVSMDEDGFWRCIYRRAYKQCEAIYAFTPTPEPQGSPPPNKRHGDRRKHTTTQVRGKR